MFLTDLIETFSDILGYSSLKATCADCDYFIRSICNDEYGSCCMNPTSAFGFMCHKNTSACRDFERK